MSITETVEPQNVIEVSEISTKPKDWKIYFFSDRLDFYCIETDHTYSFSRQNWFNTIEIASLPFGSSVALQIKLHKHKVLLKLSKEQEVEIKKWLGPFSNEHLKSCIKKQSSFLLPLSGFFAIFQIMIFMGSDVIYFKNVVILGFWVTVFFGTLITKKWPRREMFLIHMSIFLFIIIENIYRLTFDGGIKWFSIALIFFCLFFVKKSYLDYRKFANMQK